MSPSIDTALIHRAREVGSTRGAPGTRTAQGSFPRTPFEGPWIPARVMLRGSVAPKTRDSSGAEARVLRGYEMLLDTEDESGDAVTPPTASSVFETDCEVLDSPTIELDGEPELLNNGEEQIGWLCFGDVPVERS